MNRPRACVAIFHNDQILMVLHKTAERTYWTLPGGGWEEGETIEQTAMREVKEETGLEVDVEKLLFEEEYVGGTSYCYLAKLKSEHTEPNLEFLPKEESIFGTMLRFTAWHSLKDKKDDTQVSKVISALNLSIT